MSLVVKVSYLGSSGCCKVVMSNNLEQSLWSLVKFPKFNATLLTNCIYNAVTFSYLDESLKFIEIGLLQFCSVIPSVNYTES